MTYKASTTEGINQTFENGRGDIYAVYLATKWAVMGKLELVEVVRLNSNGTTSVVFDKDY